MTVQIMIGKLLLTKEHRTVLISIMNNNNSDNWLYRIKHMNIQTLYSSQRDSTGDYNMKRNDGIITYN